MVKQPAHSRRGLSLIEIVVVFAILAVLLGITAISLRSTIQREGPRAMALNLVSDLRAARTEASRSGKMVAVCFPSNGKKNAFSRNALVRKGAQTGHVLKTLPYDKGYNGFIFAGTWPDSESLNFEIPIPWSTSTADELCIFFRPDGTAFSNDIPAVEGNYPLLVGSGFVSSGEGPETVLTAVGEPYTIWVSGSGNITLEDRTTPAGTLPPTDIKPVPASSRITAQPGDAPPKIEHIKFLPEPPPGADRVGLGQNYVDIHPDQKQTEDDRLEYGIATMLITASDKDGGPLYFDLSAVASDGDEGNFTVSQETGAMDYIYDPKTNSGKWQALVSWRPPPGADEDTVYELQVTIRDEQGLTAFTSSGAGLLPLVQNLPPSRMVLQTEDEQLFLTNIEGGSAVKLTKDDEAEYEPFFSPDGTRIYSKHRTAAGGLEFRVRNADGSGLRVLKEFSPAIVAENSVIIGGKQDILIDFDPTNQYAVYRTNRQPGSYDYKIPVKKRLWPKGPLRWTLEPAVAGLPDGSSYTYELQVLHLNSGTPPITVDTEAYGSYYWDGETDHTLRFQSVTSHEPHGIYQTPTDEQRSHGISPYIGNLGRDEDPGTGVKLEGFPPNKRIVSSTPVPSANKSFNPAEPNWYISNTGTGLQLMRRGSIAQKTVATGTIVGKPSWSSDGRFVAYVSESGPGANRQVVVKEVLNADFSQRSTPETKYTYSGPNLTDAKLSPKGRWVFFIQNKKLYRAINSTGSTPVQISGNLGKNIADIAVSQ